MSCLGYVLRRPPVTSLHFRISHRSDQSCQHEPEVASNLVQEALALHPQMHPQMPSPRGLETMTGTTSRGERFRVGGKAFLNVKKTHAGAQPIRLSLLPLLQTPFLVSLLAGDLQHTLQCPRASRCTVWEPPAQHVENKTQTDAKSFDWETAPQASWWENKAHCTSSELLVLFNFTTKPWYQELDTLVCSGTNFSPVCSFFAVALANSVSCLQNCLFPYLPPPIFLPTLAFPILKHSASFLTIPFLFLSNICPTSIFPFTTFPCHSSFIPSTSCAWTDLTVLYKHSSVTYLQAPHSNVPFPLWHRGLSGIPSLWHSHSQINSRLISTSSVKPSGLILMVSLCPLSGHWLAVTLISNLTYKQSKGKLLTEAIWANNLNGRMRVSYNTSLVDI